LQLITKKIHTIWSDTRRKVVSLLSLDKKSAFNNVTHNRLLHNIRKKRILKLLLEFVKNFLRNRRITIIINNYTTTKRDMNVNISQDFSLLLILYLFYNVNLLETCDDIKLRISSTRFVNDVNILIYKESTKRNCKVLDEIYDKCEQWAQTHETKFLKIKYELIYFLRTFKWFNMSVDVALTRH
jgi:hypothetical protein